MAINVAVGKPGMGKTLYLVKLAFQAYRQGIPVYSNFFIDEQKFSKLLSPKAKRGKIFFWKKIEDFISIKGGLILIDEAQVYFNSRNWKKLPLELQYKFQQHRKHIITTEKGEIIPLNIFGAVQNVKRIDPIVRELVNEIHHCKMLTIFNKNILLKVAIMDIDDVDKQMENIDKRTSTYYWKKIKITYKNKTYRPFGYSLYDFAQCYNTYDTVEGFIK